MWFTSHHPKSAKSLLEVQISNCVLSVIVYYLVMWNIGVRMTFGFSLCTISLQVTLVIYFRYQTLEYDKWLSSLEGGRYIVTNTKS